jgi:ketosteroid isomerase-like protein
VSPDAAAVLAAAERRAAALVAGDAGALTSLHHEQLRWTTHRGEVLDRDAYVRGNTAGDLVWRAQALEEPEVVVVGDTAVLRATVVDDVERGGAAHRHRLLLTQTWIRGGGGDWTCLAAHASAAA